MNQGSLNVTAATLFRGLEDGGLSDQEINKAADTCDAVLMYFILRYLREKYPATNPSSSGVLERLIKLTSANPRIVNRTREAESDSMVEWFDDTYSMREFFQRRDEFIDLICEKLDS